MKKNKLIYITILAIFCLGTTLSAQCVSADEADLVDLCVTATETANAAPVPAGTFDVWDAGTNAAGTDGTDDISLTLEAMVFTPNANGTCDDGDFTITGCVGPATPDFSATSSDDCYCTNGYVCVTVDMINGFSSEASGLDFPFTSVNGSTEGHEAMFAYVTAGTDATGAPLTLPTVNLGLLSTFCEPEYNAGPVSTFVGATGPGSFSVDQNTGVTNNCATSGQAGEDTDSGDNPGDNSDAQSENPNWGLNATDVITQYKIIYFYGNTPGTDCDGDGDTGVGSNPSANFGSMDFCPPPACVIDPATVSNIACDDNGTPTDTSDDFITFDITATGTNSATTYDVTGATLTPTSGTYGMATSFASATGTAGAGDLMLTLTDATDPNCTAMVTVTDPGTCESCDPAIAAATAPPAVITSESVCQADNVSLAGGVVDPPATMCPAGSTLEYSLDMGPWSTMIPVYDQMTSIQIDTRCVCDLDPSIISAIGTAVTVPGVCPTCDPIIVVAQPVCSAVGGTYDIEIVSITGGDGTGTDFTVTDGTTTITYPGTTTIPGLTYTDQNTKVTLTITDADLALCEVTYDVLQLNCEALEVCDCANCATGSYTINAQAAGNGDGFSMFYVLVDGTGNVAAVNTTGNFPNLPDVDAAGIPIVYEVNAINVLDADLAAAQAAVAVGAPFDAAALAGAFCADASCNAMFQENCMCIPDPMLTCPADVDLCGDPVAITLVDNNTNTAAASTVTYSGTAGIFINTQGTPAFSDDTIDPSLAPGPGTYTLTVVLTSADGCDSPAVECTIILMADCDAEGGRF